MCDECAVIQSELDALASSAASFIEKWIIPLNEFPDHGRVTDLAIKSGITQTLLNMGHIPDGLMHELIARTRAKLSVTN